MKSYRPALPGVRGALRSNAFRAFSLAGNEVTKGKCPFLPTDKVTAVTLSNVSLPIAELIR